VYSCAADVCTLSLNLRLQCTQFVKLSRDCQILGSTLSEADPPLTEADVQVSYTVEARRMGKGGTKKMNYNDFLTALMKLGVKVYPRSRTTDDAFQRLLMDNILPLASRRCPDNVDMFMENADVCRLYDYYYDALQQIFNFYASHDKTTHRILMQSECGARPVNCDVGYCVFLCAFSNRRSSFLHMHRRSCILLLSLCAANSAGRLEPFSPASGMRPSTPGINSMKGALGYPEFLKFASDFDLANTVILSTIELGDVYLSSLKVHPQGSTTVGGETYSTVRKLTYNEFWEALVRCALVAYSKVCNASSMVQFVVGLWLVTHAFHVFLCADFGFYGNR
jgi:hypothetical protein